MRDRRNTNLSASSTFSSDSSVSPVLLNIDCEKQLPTPPSLPPLSLELNTKENVSKRATHSKVMLTLRFLTLVCGAYAFWKFILSTSNINTSLYKPLDEVTKDNAGLINAQPLLSSEPAAIKVTDGQGQHRWTVQIPQNYSFPLQSKHVKEICKKSEYLRDEAAVQSRMMAVKDWRRRAGYYVEDKTFLEVDEAEKLGLLPPSSAQDSSKICEKSLTFAFHSEDDGFGKSLLMLWLSYGLAKMENRAFFIDDSRWLYGRYTSFFVPPPEPGCLPPPPHHVVPCPHSARHLLVSSATAPWTLGSSFEREFSQSWMSGIERSQRIYSLVRLGYEGVFKLSGENAEYAAARGATIREDVRHSGGISIGVHLRRGDLHPFEYQFSQDYLPVERYGTAARKAVIDNSTISSRQSADGKMSHCHLLLATDDPEMFDSTELRNSVSPISIHRAQERIQLATKKTLDLSSPSDSVAEPGSVYTKHVDENAGWEGGFYSGLFYAIGRTTDTSKPDSSSSSISSGSAIDSISPEARQMRELVGQAYLLDLAVLAQSDAVICASSSATCRLLAVMLGWDALKSGKWINVDDNRPWSWDGRKR